MIYFVLFLALFVLKCFQSFFLLSWPISVSLSPSLLLSRSLGPNSFILFYFFYALILIGVVFRPYSFIIACWPYSSLPTKALFVLRSTFGLSRLVWPYSLHFALVLRFSLAVFVSRDISFGRIRSFCSPVRAYPCSTFFWWYLSRFLFFWNGVWRLSLSLRGMW